MNYTKSLGNGFFVILLASSIVMLTLPTVVSAESSDYAVCAGTTLTGTTLVSSPPSGSKGPDDLTMMAVKGLDGGHEILWTAYQNGINPDGTPGKSGGPTQSTIAGYDLKTGVLVTTIAVAGKIDGLTADPHLGTLIATVNEDANSALDLVYPASSMVVTYTYNPSPEVSGNGGTDSIAVRGGVIYVSHSNPNDLAQPTDYRVTLHSSTHVAALAPVFYDSSAATSVNTGLPVNLALTDPDTNFLMPNAGERFGGSLATIGQGDGVIVFASLHGHHPRLSVLTLSDGTSNTPPTDGFAVATSDSGTLYVVDNGAGTIQAFDVSGCRVGTMFIGEPKDAGNPLVGTLNLHTGSITAFGNHFNSPKGLLFVPSTSDDGHEDS